MKHLARAALLFSLFIPSLALAETFTVILSTIPQSLHEADFVSSELYFIMNQLHSNIVRDVSPSSWKSDIVDRVEGSRDFKKYSLCVKKGLAFGNGTLVTPNHLVTSLKSFYERKILRVPMRSIGPSGDSCLSVEFQRPYRWLLEDLTHQAAVVALPAAHGEKAPIGISPYRIAEWTPSRLVLSASASSKRPYFDRIVFTTEYLKNTTELMPNIDFLRYRNAKIEKSMLKNMQAVPLTTLATLSLLINLPKDADRKALCDCIDTERIRAVEESLDWGLRLSPVGGFLPFGILGARRETLARRCVFKNYFSHKTVVRVLMNETRHSPSLEATLKHDLAKLGATAKFMTMSSADVVKAARKGDYDIYYTRIGVDFRNVLQNFDIFVADSGTQLTSVKNELIESSYRKFADVDSYEKIREIASAMNASLTEKHQILPVGQIVTNYFFSKRVADLELGDTRNGQFKIKDIPGPKK